MHQQDSSNRVYTFHHIITHKMYSKRCNLGSLDVPLNYLQKIRSCNSIQQHSWSFNLAYSKLFQRDKANNNFC